MSFALLLFAFLALPIFMVKRGFNRIGVGLVMLGISLTPWLLAGAFFIFGSEPPLPLSMAAYLSPVFTLVALLWLLVSLLTSSSIRRAGE
jgi:lipopolysaccharide export LptBFGC system permease protein LptF